MASKSRNPEVGEVVSYRELEKGDLIENKSRSSKVPFGVVFHVGPLGSDKNINSVWAFWSRFKDAAVKIYLENKISDFIPRTDGGKLGRWSGPSRQYMILQRGIKRPAPITVFRGPSPEETDKHMRLKVPISEFVSVLRKEIEKVGGVEVLGTGWKEDKDMTKEPWIIGFYIQGNGKDVVKATAKFNIKKIDIKQVDPMWDWVILGVGVRMEHVKPEISSKLVHIKLNLDIPTIHETWLMLIPNYPIMAYWRPEDPNVLMFIFSMDFAIKKPWDTQINTWISEHRDMFIWDEPTPEEKPEEEAEEKPPKAEKGRDGEGEQDGGDGDHGQPGQSGGDGGDGGEDGGAGGDGGDGSPGRDGGDGGDGGKAGGDGGRGGDAGEGGPGGGDGGSGGDGGLDGGDGGSGGDGSGEGKGGDGGDGGTGGGRGGDGGKGSGSQKGGDGGDAGDVGGRGGDGGDGGEECGAGGDGGDGKGANPGGAGGDGQGQGAKGGKGGKGGPEGGDGGDGGDGGPGGDGGDGGDATAPGAKGGKGGKGGSGGKDGNPGKDGPTAPGKGEPSDITPEDVEPGEGEPSEGPEMMRPSGEGGEEGEGVGGEPTGGAFGLHGTERREEKRPMGTQRYNVIIPGDLVFDNESGKYAVVHHVGSLNSVGDSTSVWGIWRNTEDDAEKAYASAQPSSLKAYRSGHFTFHTGDGPFYTIIKRGIPVKNPRDGRPDKLDAASNAFRDMFKHPTYAGRVPDMDINRVLKVWPNYYGKGNVERAWRDLKADGFVVKEGRMWVWPMMVEPMTGTTVMNPSERENDAKKVVEKFTWMPAKRVKHVSIPALDKRVRRITSFKTLIYESNKRLDNPMGHVKLYYHPWEDRHDRAVCITEDGKWIVAVGRAVVKKEGIDDLPIGTRPKPVKMSEVRAVPVWGYLATLIGVDVPCVKKDGGSLRYIPRKGWRCHVCGGRTPLYKMKRGMVLYDEKSRIVLAVSKVG